MVLDANPLDDIYNSDNIAVVVLNGRVYDGIHLDQLAPDKVKRAQFFWQKNQPVFAPGQSSAMGHVED